MDDSILACWGDVNEPGSDIVHQEVVDLVRPADKPAQERETLTKTVPKALIIPNKLVMNTTGAQYECWKQASQRA